MINHGHTRVPSSSSSLRSSVPSLRRTQNDDEPLEEDVALDALPSMPPPMRTNHTRRPSLADAMIRGTPARVFKKAAKAAALLIPDRAARQLRRLGRNNNDRGGSRSPSPPPRTLQPTAAAAMPTLVSNRGRLDFSTTGEDDSEDGEDSDGWTASGWSSRPASVSESLRGMHRRSKSFTSDTGGTGSGTESLTDSASSLGSEDDDDEDGDYDEDGTVSSSASMLGGGGGGGGSSDRTGSLLLPWSRHHHRHRLQKPLRISSLGPGSASAAAVVVALPQQQLHQEPFPLQYSQQQQQQQQHQHHRSSRPPRRHHTFSGVASFVGSGGSGSGSARVGELGYLPLHPLSHLGIPGQTRSRTRGGGGLIPQQLVDSEDNDNRSRDHRRVGSSGVGPTPTIQRRSRPSTSGQGVSLQLSPPPLPSPPPLLSPGAAALAPTSSYGPLPLVASPTSASMPPTSARLSPSETTPTLPQPPVSPQLAVEEVPPIDTVPGFPALPMRLTRAVDLSALSAEGPLDVPVSLPSLTPAIRQGGAKPSGPPLATLPHRALARQWLLTRMDVSTRSPRGQLVLELVAGHLYVGAVPPASVTRDHSDGADPVASGDEGLVEVHLEWRGHVPRAWALDLAAAHALILPGPSSRGMTSATTPLSRSGQGPSLASHRGGGGVVLAPGSASGLAAAAGTLDQARRTLPASALPPPPPLAVLLITELEVLVVVPSTRHLKRRFIGDWRWAGGAAGGGGAGSGPIVFGAHGALFGTMAARSDLEDMVDTVTEAHDSAVDRYMHLRDSIAAHQSGIAALHSQLANLQQSLVGLTQHVQAETRSFAGPGLAATVASLANSVQAAQQQHGARAHDRAAVLARYHRDATAALAGAEARAAAQRRGGAGGGLAGLVGKPAAVPWPAWIVRVVVGVALVVAAFRVVNPWGVFTAIAEPSAMIQ